MIVLVDECRAITGADDMDQRPTQMTIRKRVWSGGAVDVGDPTDTDLVLVQHFKIRIMSGGMIERSFGSGGSYKPGEWVQAVVTPPFPGCGYTLADILPGDQPKGTEILYLLSSNAGPSGIDGVFRRHGAWNDRPYRITFFLQRSNRSDEVPTP